MGPCTPHSPSLVTGSIEVRAALAYPPVLPPFVPSVDPLLENLEVFWFGHGLNLSPRCWVLGAGTWGDNGTQSPTPSTEHLEPI
jgi:hypothetical protein